MLPARLPPLLPADPPAPSLACLQGIRSTLGPSRPARPLVPSLWRAARQETRQGGFDRGGQRVHTWVSPSYPSRRRCCCCPAPLPSCPLPSALLPSWPLPCPSALLTSWPLPCPLCPLALCPLGLCPLGLCPLGLCPLGLCPLGLLAFWPLPSWPLPSLALPLGRSLKGFGGDICIPVPTFHRRLLASSWREGRRRR